MNTQNDDDDPIVSEVRRLREEYFANLGFDIDRFYAEAERRQRAHSEKLVSFDKRSTEPD